MLAAPINSITCSPAFIGHPPTSTSSAEDAGHGGDGALPPQQLLDGGSDDRLVPGHLAPVLGLLRQVAEDAVEGVGHGVEPGDDEEEADVEDLLVGERHPVDLGPHDPGQQVLGGGPAPLDQGLLEVGVDGVGRLLPRRRLVLLGGPRGPDDPVLHFQELVQILEGQAHQPEEDRAGKGHGEFLVEVQ